MREAETISRRALVGAAALARRRRGHHQGLEEGRGTAEGEPGGGQVPRSSEGTAALRICLNFRPPGACQFVESPISPKGWCQFFAAKENAQ